MVVHAGVNHRFRDISQNAVCVRRTNRQAVMTRISIPNVLAVALVCQLHLMWLK
jgi:hypothetical protein